MKKWLLLSVMLGAMPLTMMAQDDDMYFVPKKETVAKRTVTYGIPRNTYYSGSNRDVDEYNRRGSYYEPVAGDSLNDIIDFSAVKGVYPDSLAGDDFELTRQMSRFDDYQPNGKDAYWEGYSDGRNSTLGWHSPWYYSSYYPWYTGWYDPWYYDPWYTGWYDPWYYGYGYYGWYRPYYSSWVGGYYYSRPYHYYGYTSRPLRRDSGRSSFGATGGGRSSFGSSSRSAAAASSSRGRSSFGASRPARTSTTVAPNYSNGNNSFGASRATTNSSFGASQSSGSSFGASRSVGGGGGGGGSFGASGGGGARSSGGGGGGGFGRHR